MPTIEPPPEESKPQSWPMTILAYLAFLALVGAIAYVVTHYR